MTKFLTAIALSAVIAAPTIASDAPAKRSFVRDGQTYVYTATHKADRLILDGRRFPSGRAFQLTVRNGRVSGVSGGVPVSFSVAEATPIDGAELASR